MNEKNNDRPIWVAIKNNPNPTELEKKICSTITYLSDNQFGYETDLIKYWGREIINYLIRYGLIKVFNGYNEFNHSYSVYNITDKLFDVIELLNCNDTVIKCEENTILKL